MRKQLLKINVSAEYYEIVKTFSSKNIPFISQSDSQPIKKGDFIVFADFQGNETLRNMCEINKDTIFYTDCFSTVHCGLFPLVVVLTNLYHSILHIRLGAFTDKKISLGKFPVDMVRHELCIIQLCTDLLREAIDVKQFITKLDTLTAEDDDYYFESSTALMEHYPWEYRETEQSKEATDKICHAVTEIEKCLENKNEWRNIWRIAYGIHNIPASIYHAIAE